LQDPRRAEKGNPVHLSAFIEALESVSANGARYHEVMSRIGFGIEEVEKYCHFDPDQYTRNLIVRTDAFELIILCWEPGQTTPIHDHGSSDGWVHCLQGQIEEVRFQCFPSNDGSHRVERGDVLRAKPGNTTYINDDIAWHTVANPTLERVVSLNLYSDPIDSCRYFDPGSRTIKTRQMTYYSVDGAVVQRT
jgi:cysteine dioxygenase